MKLSSMKKAEEDIGVFVGFGLEEIGRKGVKIFFRLLALIK